MEALSSSSWLSFSEHLCTSSLNRNNWKPDNAPTMLRSVEIFGLWIVDCSEDASEMSPPIKVEVR